MDPDRDLVILCRSEDDDVRARAFRRLYELYRDRVYNTALRIIGNASDALDASQETFSIIHRKVGKFRFDSKFSSWVYRIAVNTSIDLRRRDQSRRMSSTEATEQAQSGLQEPAESEDRQPHRSLGSQELERQVQEAISALSPKLREVVVLRYTEGLSYEEVAETLQCSIGTVKSRLARAHDALERGLSRVIDQHYFDV
ncbi:MAG: sigma-70 family RNA polymerase sigma factor [Planctomycetes bacterium]|nr:sigma-70 family RNA polymerase sigma factor [Planctomycetota bacterium]